MPQSISADKVSTRHSILNPLPVQGEGPWARVTEVHREGDNIFIKTANWSIRRAPKEGVTVIEND